MDNDLMARRLRPPSQPNSGSGQQPADQAGQVPSPWDVPLTDDGQFAPPQPPQPNQDPPFAPQWAPPDPQSRADVPWDRPPAEPWPPADEFGSSQNAGMPPDWSAQGGDQPAVPARPEWPAADDLAQTPAPWDHPEAKGTDQWRDPDDAFAPVIADVNAPVAWAAWSGNGNGNGNGYDAGYANGNGNGYASSGGNGIRYAAANSPEPPSAPEPMTVSAHSDQPPAGDEPRSSGSSALPDWPAEDDLSVAPPSGRGPVMPEDSWPMPPAWPQAEGPATPAEPPAPLAPPAPTDWTEPAAAQRAAAEPVPPPQPEPEPAAPQPAAPQPTASQPTLELATPPNTQIVSVTPGGTAQNMVLRIELAIVDESKRANPADTAKRVGPDADVRRPEYEPRNSGGRTPMPEPEYIWGAPPEPQGQQHQGQRRPGQGQPAQPNYPVAPAQHVAPPPSAWLPAPPQQPQPAQNLDWDLPQVAPGQPPMADPPAPWSSPAAPQHQQGSPYAPAPTWAMTQPTPPFQPEPPQYMPPPVQPYQPPQAPQYQQATQQYQAPAAPQYPQPAWPSAPQPFDQPTRPQHMPQPVQSAPLVSAPAAGSRARTGGVAADQADLWFLNSQPAAATVVDDDAPIQGRSNSILTAGLTVGFAVLVIVLVLVFIQLMTSLLR